LARAQGRIDEKYDARMMINDQTGALTLTLILRDTAPADLDRADLLIDYFSKSFGERDLPIIVAYGNIHGEERYEGTLHSYQQERSRGEVKRTPIEKLTPKPRRPLA
jgi:hypothetical protein